MATKTSTRTATKSNRAGNENPDRSYLVALLLSYFLGYLGIDRFYLNRNRSAILKLITFGGLGIWMLIDLILIAFGRLTVKDDDRKLGGFAQNYSWVKIAAVVLIIFNVVFAAIGTYAFFRTSMSEEGFTQDQQTEFGPESLDEYML